MKYDIKLDNINLNNEMIESVDINILQSIDGIYVNNKNKIEICIRGRINSRDNQDMKNIQLIKKLIEVKDKYFDISIKVDELYYEIPKLYIYKFIQKFNKGEGEFEILLYQKFIGEETEMRLLDSDSRN